MTNLKSYNWLLTIAGGVLLLGFGIYMIFFYEKAENIVLIIIGIGLIIAGIIRLFPTIEVRNESPTIMKILVVEIIFTIAVGVLLVYFGFQPEAAEGELGASFEDLFLKYFLGIVFYFRGFITLLLTVKQYEKYDIILFLLSIVFITVGTIIIVTNTLTIGLIVILFIIISLTSGGFTSYLGYQQYNQYRLRKSGLIEDADEKNTNNRKGKVVPKKDRERQRPNIQA